MLIAAPLVEPSNTSKQTRDPFHELFFLFFVGTELVNSLSRQRIGLKACIGLEGSSVRDRGKRVSGLRNDVFKLRVVEDFTLSSSIDHTLHLTVIVVYVHRDEHPHRELRR